MITFFLVIVRVLLTNFLTNSFICQSCIIYSFNINRFIISQLGRIIKNPLNITLIWLKILLTLLVTYLLLDSLLNIVKYFLPPKITHHQGEWNFFFLLTIVIRFGSFSKIVEEVWNFIPIYLWVRLVTDDLGIGKRWWGFRLCFVRTSVDWGSIIYSRYIIWGFEFLAKFTLWNNIFLSLRLILRICLVFPWFRS